MNSSTPGEMELTSAEKRELLARYMDSGSAGVRLSRVSFAQQRLWFLEQLAPGTAANNISSGLRFSGNLDVRALDRSIARIVERHETLRTSFVAAAGEVFQKISETAFVGISVDDLRGMPDDAREREVYRLASEAASAPFDLQTSPLLRAKLIQTKNDEQIFVFTVHHLVSDGWSINVFVEELIEFYEAEIERRPGRLDPLTIQYTEFAAWQHDIIQGQEFRRQIEYWKTRLAKIGSPLQFPGDHPPAAEQSFASGLVSFPVPASLMEGLKKFAQNEGCTPFAILLTVFGILLHRYTQQEDISIGVPVAGRRFLETESLIGLFANPLVIRIDLSGNLRFRDALSEVREALLEADSSQDLPFERLVEELQPKRSLTHHPVFQVMMTAIKDTMRERTFAGLTVNPYPIGVSGSALDLIVFVVEAADGSTWLRFQYNASRFDAARIWRASGHYQSLLNSVLENPDCRIGSLDLLTAAEIEQFSTWNARAADYRRTCVHELIAHQAACSPDRVAAAFGEKQVTYAELMRDSLRVAGCLRAAGAAKGVPVAVYLERSLEMIPAVLGILMSGAAYVPLDTAEPAARLTFKLENSGAAILLTQRALAARLPAAGTQILVEDALATPREWLPEAQDPESPAYVTYTSGSTGKPKGVCVSHRALVNLLSSMRHEPGLEEGDRFLAVTNLCFDISALELFLPLIVGATLIVASREEVIDGATLLQNLRHCGITAMQATPSTWRMLLEAGWTRDDVNLKVMCGGEALPAELAKELIKRSDSVWNLYGPSETTVWSSVSRIREGSGVAIGRPIQNSQFYVLDRRRKPVPVGIPGELYIGGDGLADGYWKDPELTDERFVANPFKSGERLYRTGDEVRFRADGEVEFLGRLDSQVKLRGHRIELGEVEFIATQHAGVSQAVARIRNNSSGDRLVCYIVPRRGVDLRAAELRAAMKDQLPDYMIPSIVVLESLPLNGNGKIDVANLPEPAGEMHAPSRAPTVVELQLLGIWKRVLKREDIGITDNFFDAGGHSLLAMKLLAEVTNVFGRSLPTATIFKAPTVEQMAVALGQQFSKPCSSLVTLQPLGLQPPLFLIPGANGNALAYVDFAKSLGVDQPVHLLQPVGFEGLGMPLKQIQEVAAKFLEEIRNVQPRGPYRLVGFCVGGIVAFEMAQQLIAAGEEPPRLALVETWHPKSVPTICGAPAVLRPLIFFARGIKRHLGAMLRLPPREAWRYFGEHSPIVKEMILRRDVYRGVAYKRYVDFVVEAAYRAGSNYVPAPYVGNILLFVAGNLKVDAAWDTRLVWRDLASDGCAVVRMTASDFGELLKKPCVKLLADELTAGLRNWPRSARAASV